MEKEKDLIIIGEGTFAEVAYQCFTHDSPYKVIAFSVERKYFRSDSLFGLPVVPFEEIQEYYTPGQVYFYVAITCLGANQVRTRLYHKTKELGYQPASYISSSAFVWPNVEVGEHSFIFENCTVQPFVSLGRNVILWSGCVIAHHSKLGDHCFVGAGAAINGTVDIGQYIIIDSNATIANHITVGDRAIVGAASYVASNVESEQIVMGIWRKKTISSQSRLTKEFQI